ncbi:MAG TPA: type VI secretion system baseplate subunit TssG, partial [Candidatus Polarisedimenticolia bacterium]|nr:type VI secretion system baseplate subunit TssG [Candidatus Polarisedimenticolia bacterium]
MEPEERTTDADLIRALAREARLYSFFQVVQLLERARPEAAPLGQEGPPSREAVRLRPSLSLAFPESDVAAVEVLEDGERPRVLVETNFLGLYGSTSPLPTYYAEELLQDTSEESLVRGVLDLFHHRLLSLLYRCWKKYRPYLQFRPDGRDEFSWRLLCLMGLGIQEAAERCALPTRWLLRYCGLLNQQPRSAAALQCAISDFFEGVPVEVTSYAERWVTIPEESRCRLGSLNSRLGVDLQVGERVEDRAGKFRVTLGPMDLDTYISFLPGRRNLDIVSGLAR